MFHAQVGDDGKMVAQCFADANVLFNSTTGVCKDIVDPKRWRNAIKRATDTGSSFYKCVFHSLSNRTIGITVRNIIKIAANDYRVWTLINFFPDPVALDLSFHEPVLEFPQDIFRFFDVCFIIEGRIINIFPVIGAEFERLKVDVEYAESVLRQHDICILEN